MKRIFVVLIALLPACQATIPSETVNAIASAGGGCAKVSGVWGQGVVMIGSADKGVIRNGEVVIADNCGGIQIRNQPK